MPRNDKFALSNPVFSEPVFNESGNPTPDPHGFTTPHPSDTQLYNQIQDLLAKDVVSFTQMRGNPQDLFSLSAALGEPGPQMVQAIQAKNQIAFQVIGDSGASASSKYVDDVDVSDAITNDYHTSNPASVPSFLYHVGDVVYDFCESQYWFDQFYDPYRNYPNPIFAIPGNHDSFVVPNTPPDQTPLTTFSSNFCAVSPVVTKEAGSLHRTAMTQPGVYFTLDAPFVRIIGLFSNALEDPGVISSESGKWTSVPDFQLDYLKAQLQQVVAESYAGALLIAVHHPPFTYAPQSTGAGGDHYGSFAMLAEIDTICSQVGVYPHAFLSGHAHNYQRYTRNLTFNGKAISVPCVVCGNGGHNVNSIVSPRGGVTPPLPTFKADVSYLDQSAVFSGTSLVINEFDVTCFGYLNVTANATQLTIMYRQVNGNGTVFTPVVVDLATHTCQG